MGYGISSPISEQLCSKFQSISANCRQMRSSCRQNFAGKMNRSASYSTWKVLSAIWSALRATWTMPFTWKPYRQSCEQHCQLHELLCQQRKKLCPHHQQLRQLHEQHELNKQLYRNMSSSASCLNSYTVQAIGTALPAWRTVTWTAQQLHGNTYETLSASCRKQVLRRVGTTTLHTGITILHELAHCRFYHTMGTAPLKKIQH